VKRRFCDLPSRGLLSWGDVVAQVLMGFSVLLVIKHTATHQTMYKIDVSEYYGPFKIPSPTELHKF